MAGGSLTHQICGGNGEATLPFFIQGSDISKTEEEFQLVGWPAGIARTSEAATNELGLFRYDLRDRRPRLPISRKISIFVWHKSNTRCYHACIFSVFAHGPNLLLISGPSLWDTLMTNAANIVLGIYAVIRGWDNVATALRDM